jgi:3-oxoacyl-[acyl-carrier protein] reductase
MRLNAIAAVVTGGASGFGEEICRSFAREGARVMIADINRERGEALARELVEAGLAARFCATDVTRSADWARLADTTLQAFDRVDVVVNNAGISHANQPMLEVPEAMFDRVMQVNVKSIYLSALHFVPIFRRQQSGGFINLGSTGAVRPRPGLTWYNGSKGAVVLLTKSMAVELAPDRIRVNCLNPALAETPLLTTFMGGEDTPERRARFLSTIPLGRLGRPSDVAHAAVFLADPASEFITGACLEVDGGRCI